MTAREKARLRRMVEVNAWEYRAARRHLTWLVMRGIASTTEIDESRRRLLSAANCAIEAMASLSDHADEKED